MGGAWERLCDLSKRVGRYIERGPREEVLHTLLLEAEHIVNSRPLTERATDDNVLHGPANWRTCQRLADHFWQRWLREYLPTLVPADALATLYARAGRGRHRADRRLIITSIPWPRGRIKKTYPGPDNQVRVVDVETTGGVLRRPTSRSSCCQLRRRLFRVLV
ncbi:hypothetical protein EVAR_75571_1 [Eumeta japonica]|uniref:DUF5641 domain-containing protein n=1 Tax=Eumeta variegata TaxID=151549 RepID=A0A4C1UJE0_EUMVA|nr:hypothetical protein EVAR_75571_1 [Eumeta japonica]